jgi:hypothetical protein
MLFYGNNSKKNNKADQQNSQQTDVLVLRKNIQVAYSQHFLCNLRKSPIS